MNRSNPIAGRITHSNLCSEILQVSTPSAFNEDLTYETIGDDISCNLAHECQQGYGLRGLLEDHRDRDPRFTAVSDQTDINPCRPSARATITRTPSDWAR